MNRSEAVDILLAARDRVADGWCQRVLEDSNGNVCVLGAIRHVGKGHAHARSMYLVVEAVQHHIHGQINFWNDQPDRTQDQAIDMLNDCAIAVKAGEIGSFDD